MTKQKRTAYKIVCPYCGSEKTDITDGWASSLVSYRRRRRCLGCDHRWSTIEMTILHLMDAVDAMTVRSTKLTSAFWKALGISKPRLPKG